MNTLIDAQFVKVIRCKDCVWWDKCDGKYSVCCKPSHHMRNVPSSGLGFCSDGELKDDSEIKNKRNYNHCINCGFVSLHKITINGISYKIDYPNRYCPNCGEKIIR